MSSLQTLAENRYNVKRSAATRLLGHFRGMATSKKNRVSKPHKTTTQTLFVKRVLWELEQRELSVDALSKRVGGPRQKTLDDVIYGGAVPRLTLIHQTAVALDMSAWELLQEPPAEAKKQPKVVPLRTHQDIFPKADGDIRKTLTERQKGRKIK